MVCWSIYRRLYLAKTKRAKKMIVKLAKWGNSAAIRLPKAVVEQAKISHGDSLEISVDRAGQIVLNPERPRYTLEQLLGGVTTKNRHAEADWGRRAGKEAW